MLFSNKEIKSLCTDKYFSKVLRFKEFERNSVKVVMSITGMKP